MDFDFSEDFESGLGQPSPLQKLRQEWSSRREQLHRSILSPAKPEARPHALAPLPLVPQELFPSPQRNAPLLAMDQVLPSQQADPSGAQLKPGDGVPEERRLEEPKEDAFVAANASVRQLEYEKLEIWISSGGPVDDFAPWFREMLMDQDDASLISALRAVQAHYRRAAQQRALGDRMATAVPICWLSVLAERLMRCDTGPVTREVAALVAACLAAFQGCRSELSRHQAFLERFGALPRGKVHLLAACEGVLQSEDWQEMWRVVQNLPTELLPSEAWQKLPEAFRTLAQQEPGAGTTLANDLTSPARSPVLGAATPKTWRQRVRCLEHLTPGGDVQNLWPQLILQVEDDHPAVSAAALQCLARLSPQMPVPADHLTLRLANALRQRLREPRCRPRSAAVELLRCLATQRCLGSTAVTALLAQTFGVSKERARKAVLEMAERSSVIGEVPGPLEALLLEAFPRGAPATPERGLRLTPQKPGRTALTTPATPATAAPSVASPALGTEEEKPSTPRKVLELETLRGSGPLTPLPSDSKLLSFEATPQKQMTAEVTCAFKPPKKSDGHESHVEANRADDCGYDECHGDESDREVESSDVPRNALPGRPTLNTGASTQSGISAGDHAELAWSFHKIHMITLDFSRPGVDEVELWQKLSQLLSRSAFHGPLRRFLERWRQRQRRKAAAKENFAPGKSGTLRLDDYASLRELCSDEDLTGAFPASVLSHLRRTLTTGSPSAAVVQAAVRALEKCAIACGRALPLRRFAAPLLRLCATRRGASLRAACAAALLRGAVELRNAWRTWMQVSQTSAGLDQALLAESLELVATLEQLPCFEIPSEVLQDILAVVCPHLQAERPGRVALASHRCLQSFRNLLGTERLKEEVSKVAPKLNLDVLEPTGGIDTPTAGPVALAAAVAPRRSRSVASPASSEASRMTKRLAPEAARSSALAPHCQDTSELQIFEAQILDLPTLRTAALLSPGALRRMWQDLAARFAPKAMAKLLLAAATSVRLCIETAEEATAVSSLKAAHEVLLALRSSCDELLRNLGTETSDLFHCFLEILLQLETVSASEGLRQWTTPILLEVPPFFARLMDVIQADQQLLAWLDVALNLLSPDARRARVEMLPSAKKSWALRFCARATERCIGALEGDEHWAWEVLAKATQIRAQLGPGEFGAAGNGWPGILEALCVKVTELYPCQARDLVELAGASDGFLRTCRTAENFA